MIYDWIDFLPPTKPNTVCKIKFKVGILAELCKRQNIELKLGTTVEVGLNLEEVGFLGEDLGNLIDAFSVSNEPLLHKHKAPIYVNVGGYEKGPVYKN